MATDPVTELEQCEVCGSYGPLFRGWVFGGEQWACAACFEESEAQEDIEDDADEDENG